ncbi:MAG: Cysteine desulfurase [Candidatus Amesbacteria bacterium GW2011_GWA2_42_12]|uniref:Cysteine desulfurase n=1 Tax=Candidatus Amesbacteria bacterium GW2011_GWA2_42_12 TaxID=1618356 RepID=A0A0G1A8P3_9BACT|nr:MAG: Cysteine desulfurase [Candidatus Amesbacteria bacterium GW2011_GWA2_42_12]
MLPGIIDGMFDVQKIRKDFPILSRKVQGSKQLVYLDSAATSQKPQGVLDAMNEYYTHFNANVHRGIHTLGNESTSVFQNSRQKIAQFFGADDNELILVRNTTEGLNALCYMWGEKHISEGDMIVSTEMEHHSNFVPWQQLAKRKHATFTAVHVHEHGELDLHHLEELLKTKKVKLIAVVHVSNAIGTINPIERIVELSHQYGAKVIVDGAQSASHMPVNFHKLEYDAYAFSGHKMLGPMGIGGLLVRAKIIDELQPYVFGGGMIDTVSVEETTFAELPDKYIAGTPDVASTVGLAVACGYLNTIDMKKAFQHDQELVAYALEKLSAMKNVKIVGPLDVKKRCGSVAFLYHGVHAHDVAQILDSEGVAVRSGHHCTMPLHTKFGWIATTRASFNVYSTTHEIDVLVQALQKVKVVFGK